MCGRPRPRYFPRQQAEGSVYGFTLHVIGRVDGAATLTLLLGGEPYRVDHLRGDVDFDWGGEWYADTLQVRYQPADMEGRHLTIRYAMHRS